MAAHVHNVLAEFEPQQQLGFILNDDLRDRPQEVVAVLQTCMELPDSDVGLVGRGVLPVKFKLAGPNELFRVLDVALDELV